MNHSTIHVNTEKRHSFSLPGYSEMELSTQILIQAALKFGLEVDVKKEF